MSQTDVTVTGSPRQAMQGLEAVNRRISELYAARASAVVGSFEWGVIDTTLNDLIAWGHAIDTALYHEKADAWDRVAATS